MGASGRQLGVVVDKWKTIGRRLGAETTSEGQLGDKRKTLGDNWKTNSGRQLGNVKDNYGNQFGDHIWETSGRPLGEIAGRHHLGEKRKTTRQAETPWRQLGDNMGSRIWVTSGRQLWHNCETSGRQLENGGNWETTSVRQLGDNWVTSGRQLEHNGKTSGRQLVTSGRPHGGDNWELRETS